MITSTGHRQPVSATERRNVLVSESLLVIAATTSVPTTTPRSSHQPRRALTVRVCPTGGDAERHAAATARRNEGGLRPVAAGREHLRRGRPGPHQRAGRR